MAETEVRLQPFRESDLALLERWATDPGFSEPFEWSGFRSPEVLRQRWEAGGFLDSDPHYLAVADNEGTTLGLVMWEPGYRALGGTGVWVVGILLAPEHRGRGVGTTAQRLLAAYLFDTTPAHRLLAFTEATNTAEQRALENCGFQREGVFRKGGFRGGEWRDVCAYGLLREEFKAT